MLMLFFFIMPAAMSGLGNLLLPIHLSTPEMLYPRVNNLGGILYSASVHVCTSRHTSAISCNEIILLVSVCILHLDPQLYLLLRLCSTRKSCYYIIPYRLWSPDMYL